MKKMYVTLALAAAFFIAGSAAFASDSALSITAPSNDEQLSSGMVDISFELHKEKDKRIDHVHLFVDGDMRKAIVGKNTVAIQINPGTHKLKVVAATKGHQLLSDIFDEITIKVK